MIVSATIPRPITLLGLSDLAAKVYAQNPQRNPKSGAGIATLSLNHHHRLSFSAIHVGAFNPSMIPLTISKFLDRKFLGFHFNSFWGAEIVHKVLIFVTEILYVWMLFIRGTEMFY